MIRNKDKKMNLGQKMELANQWNRFDIAEIEIFNKQNRKELFSKKLVTVSKLFKESLVRNKVEFVKLVLKYFGDSSGYEQFVTDNMHLLYKECINPEFNTSCDTGQSLHDYIQSSKQTMWKWKKNRVCQNDQEYLNDINQAIKELLGNWKLMPFVMDEHDKFLSKHPFKELFIWAVLLNRKEMAEIFWKKDKDFIFAALYASSLAKKLKDNISLRECIEIKASYAESSKYYENLAYNVMTELYQTNKSDARKLLVKKNKKYGSTTIFEITDSNNLMQFMGHTACQTQLTSIWKGKIPTYTTDVTVILGVFLPILIPIMIITTEKENLSKQTPPNSPDVSYSPTSLTTMTSTSGSATSANNNQMREADYSKTTAFRQRIQRIYYFYKAPVTKFVCNLLAYIIFLIVFSLFVLTDLHPVYAKSISFAEYLTCGWAASMMIEELRQVFVLSEVPMKFITWSNVWTLYEICMYSMFVTSVVLRVTMSADYFIYARSCYAITLGLFILNSMQYLRFSKSVGPKVIMMGQMMRDMIFFVLIFAVFLFGFGVMFHANMYPNAKLDYNLLIEIIHMPYWQLYGELFLDVFEGKETDCSTDPALYWNGTYVRCAEHNEMSSALLAIYMILTNVILLNFLIAMFSYTFQRSQNNNALLWTFHRYSLIKEYHDRCLLVPPFIILNHTKRALFYIFHKCCTHELLRKENVFRLTIEGEEKKRLDLKEAYAVKSLTDRLKHENQGDKVKEDIGRMNNNLKSIITDIKDMKNDIQKIFSAYEDISKGINSLNERSFFEQDTYSC